MEKNWHSKENESILFDLNTRVGGLSPEEAKERLNKYGPNALPEEKEDSYFLIFLRQFKSPLIYILLIASFVIMYIGGLTDAITIFAVLFINAVIGTFQEGRARSALQALKHFTETRARVMRGEVEIDIKDSEIVPGDIIVMREGERVPADARLLSTHSLKVNEASLTGESVPAQKISESIGKLNLPVSDQQNMLFKGTTVVSGSGHAVVVATGINTYIGKISKEIMSIQTEIPLQKNIRILSRNIIFVVLGMSIILFFVGIFTGKTSLEMFGVVVSLAISVVPEGLPIVITLVLATGVYRMGKRNALVKRLQAVEALGQTNIIAVDKTGTLTKNELMVTDIFVDGNQYHVEGNGYEPKGDIYDNGAIIDPSHHVQLQRMGHIAALSVTSDTVYNQETHTWQVFGDPTEAALGVFAKKIGIQEEALKKESPQLSEIPFDYTTKYHAVVHEFDGVKKIYITGAPEVIIKRAKKYIEGGVTHEFTQDAIEKYELMIEEFSKKGLRVIGVAEKTITHTAINDSDVLGLTFFGLIGMKDILRSEVHEAVIRSKDAGVRVVMITGDHRITAQAIATEAGIFSHGDEVVSGEDVEKWTEVELAGHLGRTSVFARVTPEHKLKIIQAYRHRGDIVAMTGDGVNDAPSLTAADLGVSMGGIGTEVAKEASDIVLLDDNFGSIVSAIEEGRTIYRTIKKVIMYLFSTGVGEAFTIIIAVLFGLPLPILAAQIVWLNLVTDGFLVIALAMEPKDPDLLQHKPTKNQKLFDMPMLKRMMFLGLPMSIGSLVLFSFYSSTNLIHAYSISLTSLAVFQWFNAWNCRHETSSIFKRGFGTNWYLTAALGINVVLQIAALYVPFMQKFLRTTAISLSEWGLIILVASSIIWIEEIRKLIVRRRLVRTRVAI